MPNACLDVHNLPPMLTVPEVCQLLRVSKWTVYRMCERGQLTCTRIGTRVLIPRHVVCQLLHVPVPSSPQMVAPGVVE